MSKNAQQFSLAKRVLEKYVFFFCFSASYVCSYDRSEKCRHDKEAIKVMERIYSYFGCCVQHSGWVFAVNNSFFTKIQALCIFNLRIWCYFNYFRHFRRVILLLHCCANETMIRLQCQAAFFLCILCNFCKFVKSFQDFMAQCRPIRLLLEMLH